MYRRYPAYEKKVTTKFYIGHGLKKLFRAKVFALLMDYKNGIIWTAANANSLQVQINRYKRSDRDFVSRTVAFYEQKTNQKLTAALDAARERKCKNNKKKS